MGAIALYRMKPEDKKLVAEALLEAAKAVTTSLTDLSEDDWLVVYHGTSLSEVPSLINGFDATRLKYRLYGGPKHRGLFVTPDFKTAERFAPYGEVVLELLVRAKNLHGTDYYGRTGRQQNQEQKTEEWLAGKFPNSFRPYLSLTLTQSVEPQALLIGLVSPKQILRVWYKSTRSDAGRWYTRSEFLALGLEAGPSADEPQGIKKKVEDLGIDLSSPRLSLDEVLDATARLADVPRSRVESALSVRAPKGEDEMVRLIERFGFQPKAAQAFARKFMKSLTNKQVAAALLNAANILSASGTVTTWFHGGSADDVQRVKELGHFPAEYAPRQDDRVYLTTQLGTAKSAASQAANAHGGDPVILEITGLDQSYALPDEDSRAKTAEESLARLGSIAYSITIPTSKIRAVQGKVKAS